MELSEAYRALGRERFDELIRGVSMGSLRTYQLFETIKVRARLNKLNRERLRKASASLWSRLEEGDEGLAGDLAQAILVSNLAFVIEVLDFLEIPHDGNGFFDKDGNTDLNLAEGWRRKVHEKFRESYPDALILFYINHLDWELASPTEPFVI